MLFALLGGLAFVPDPEMTAGEALTARTDPASAIIMGAVFLLGVFFLVRALRSGVVADGRGITDRGLLKTHRYEWCQIDDIVVHDTDGNILADINAPVILLGKDRGEIPLSTLAGYRFRQRATRSPVARRAARLRHLLGSHRAACRTCTEQHRQRDVDD